MIAITVDKRNATPAEAAALDALGSYEQLVASLTHMGRQAGIALTIMETRAGVPVRLQNTIEGALLMIAGQTGEPKSALNA